MKLYTVSLAVSAIEAESEADAITQFENLVGDGQFDHDSYEVEQNHSKPEIISEESDL